MEGRERKGYNAKKPANNAQRLVIVLRLRGARSCMLTGIRRRSGIGFPPGMIARMSISEDLHDKACLVLAGDRNGLSMDSLGLGRLTDWLMLCE